MAELTTLARPYAKAAFEAARESNDLRQWLEVLGLANAVSQQANVQELIFSPALSWQQKAETFVGLIGDSVPKQLVNFISLLAENRRLSLLPEIYLLFDLYKAELEKTVEVDVQTAYPLKPDLEKVLAETLAKKLNREVSLHASVDKSLLGGALIRAGDTVIDGSVRGRLAKLAEAMNA